MMRKPSFFRFVRPLLAVALAAMTTVSAWATGFIKEVKLMVEPSTERVALGMVMCVVDRDALFKHLIQNGVYCNIHWRENESTAQFEDSRYLSQHCLTLPCDQRYGIEQMNHIYKTIKDFYHHV